MNRRRNGPQSTRRWPLKFPVDLKLFEDTRHPPSIFALAASMGGAAGRLRDYSMPGNPYFPAPAVFESLRARFQTIIKFHARDSEDMVAVTAELAGLDPANIVLGNGSSEIMSCIERLMVTEAMAVPIPTFSRWTDEPAPPARTVHTFPSAPTRDFRLTPAEFVAGVQRRHARAALLCNPNDPTGALMARADVLRVLEALADLDVVVIDESFIDYAAEDDIPSIARDVGRFPNAVVLKSLGKSLGLHGLRLAYAVARPDLARRLRAALPPRNINAIAQALLEQMAGARAEYDVARRRVVRDRMHLEERLRELPGLRVYPSHANFVYVRMPETIDGIALRNHLLTEHGCLLQQCGNRPGCDSRDFRIAARPEAEVDELMQHLAESFAALGVARLRAWDVVPPPPPPARGAALAGADVDLATPGLSDMAVQAVSPSGAAHAEPLPPAPIFAPPSMFSSPIASRVAALPLRFRRGVRVALPAAAASLVVVALVLGLRGPSLTRAPRAEEGAAAPVAAEAETVKLEPPVQLEAVPVPEEPPAPEPLPAPAGETAPGRGAGAVAEGTDEPSPRTGGAERRKHGKRHLSRHGKKHGKRWLGQGRHRNARHLHQQTVGTEL